MKGRLVLDMDADVGMSRKGHKEEYWEAEVGDEGRTKGLSSSEN